MTAVIGDIIGQFVSCWSELEATKLLELAFESDLIYGYEELRNHPKVKQLSDVKYSHTVELFSFGTIDDYHGNSAQFIELNELELMKLKRLTLISVISNNTTDYDSIKSYLKIKDDFELEKFLIGCFDLHLVDIRINNKERNVKIVRNLVSRDILTESALPLKVIDESRVIKQEQLNKQLNKWVDNNFRTALKSVNDVENMIIGNNKKKRKQSEDIT